MTNELQIFKNTEFGEIRTVTEADGKVLFCGKDIAEALGYEKPRNAIEQHCRYALKRGVPHPQSPTKEIEMTFIPEGDVYRLVCNSKLPGAEKFERWVFDEVLPAIRKHGGYLTPQKVEEVLLNPDTIIRLATDLKAERERRLALEAENVRNAPKVLFADSVAASHTDILIGDLAKLLRQNGIEVGQKRLFEWLRENGYLIKQRGLSWNMPTQKAMELGLFRVKETTINKPDGSVQISKTTKVTGKGQIYFVEKFLSEKEGDNPEKEVA